MTFAWLWLVLPAEVAASAELTSSSFRVIGANTNAGSAARLESSALLPNFAGIGASIGQSEALGFSGSLGDLRSVAPGFWPVAGGAFPNLDVDADAVQSFRDDVDDGGGFGDGVEVAAGSDPTNSASTPEAPIPSAPSAVPYALRAETAETAGSFDVQVGPQPDGFVTVTVTLANGQSDQASFEFIAFRRIFVTSVVFSGNLGGPVGA